MSLRPIGAYGPVGIIYMDINWEELGRRRSRGYKSYEGQGISRPEGSGEVFFLATCRVEVLTNAEAIALLLGRSPGQKVCGGLRPPAGS